MFIVERSAGSPLGRRNHIMGQRQSLLKEREREIATYITTSRASGDDFTVNGVSAVRSFKVVEVGGYVVCSRETEFTTSQSIRVDTILLEKRVKLPEVGTLAPKY
uniref:Uncharacterized protein n=1 Tax=Timema tahoe TaxID=61484 RepID=A0A7R9NV44_9NEOP|nr:unnamed protein product [Timema tahoe]